MGKLSQDSSGPDLQNPQSLNKYSYCFNNPLKYNDPSGKWPNWSNIGKAISKGFQTAVNVVKENMDVVHTVLDVAGMIPGVGEAFDAVNGVIYAAEGDFTNAGLSFTSCIPVVGNAIGGVKIASAAVGIVSAGFGLARGIEKVADVGRAIDKAGDAAKVGWKLGDPINTLTKAGNPPSPSTINQGYWKNQSLKTDRYTQIEIDRMRKGLAHLHPDAPYPVSRELHHPLGRAGENIYNFIEVWPWEHAQIDPHRFWNGWTP